MSLIKRLWKDEAGFVVSTELILVATLVVIGMVVGLSTVRDSVTNELADVAGAIDDVNQSYATEGIQGHSAAVAGFGYLDALDYCDTDDDAKGAPDQCVTIAPKTGGGVVLSGAGEQTEIINGSLINN